MDEFIPPKDMSESLKVLNKYKELIFDIKYITFVPDIEEDNDLIEKPNLIEWYIEEFDELYMILRVDFESRHYVSTYN